MLPCVAPIFLYLFVLILLISWNFTTKYCNKDISMVSWSFILTYFNIVICSATLLEFGCSDFRPSDSCYEAAQLRYSTAASWSCPAAILWTWFAGRSCRNFGETGHWSGDVTQFLVLKYFQYIYIYSIYIQYIYYASDFLDLLDPFGWWMASDASMILMWQSQ